MNSSAIETLSDTYGTAWLRFRCKDGSRGMEKRRRPKQTTSLDVRLNDEAQRLRKEAQDTPPGIERDQSIRRARQAEVAAHMQEWLTSAGLQPPK
jgi:hypothetical protein